MVCFQICLWFLTRLDLSILSGLGRPGLDVDHSPASNAEFRDAWGYISTLPYVFMA